MAWYLALLVALLAGGLGFLLTALVTFACVVWYEVSSFEGKAGFVAMGMGLIGGIAGFGIGLTVALLVPDDASLPFLRALGLSAAVLVVLAGLGAGIARALADVPPKLDGKELELEVEIRLPGDCAELPAASPEATYVELGALRGEVRRTAERGFLYLDAARREEGHWVVPACADVFTGRGARLFTIHIGEEPLRGFLVPLPGRPGKRHLSWSEWAPFPWPREATETEIHAEASFRFRVVPEEPEAPEEESP